MNNINLIIESLFRARSIQMQLRPAVLAYRAVYNKLPLKNIVANGAKTNKLFNNKLYDSHLDPEWITRLYNSPHVPDNFEISGGYDSDNLAFISFKSKLTARLQKILDKLKTFKNTYVEVDKKTFGEPLIIITTNNWYSHSEDPYWARWFDSVTSTLEDDPNYDE